MYIIFMLAYLKNIFWFSDNAPSEKLSADFCSSRTLAVFTVHKYSIREEKLKVLTLYSCGTLVFVNIFIKNCNGRVKIC